MKKIWKFISSMRFAILLLIALAIACSIGSLVTQGQTHSWYASHYSERAASWIMALGLDDAFHGWFFIAVTAFLCLNLTLCNLIRLPRLVRAAKADGRAENALKAEGDIRVEHIADPKAVFRTLRMPDPAECRDAEGREALFAAKNGAGRWGAWVCHLGILMLILGFGLGQMTQRQYTVYGVPGQTRQIGETSYYLTIDDFRIDTHEDGSAAQYTADITVENTASAGPSGGSASISVNNPATLAGMKFYQNSTGWAADIEVSKDGTLIQGDTLCAGEFLPVADRPQLVVMLDALYPDYAMLPDVGPGTASDRLNNPAYRYSIYYQREIVGQNVLMAGQTITVNEYEIRFSNPRPYTLIQIKVDHFTWLALLGGLTTLAGLVLAFYIQPSKVWAVRTDDGWTVCGQCRKGGAVFRDRFMEAAGRANEPARGKE